MAYIVMAYIVMDVDRRRNGQMKLALRSSTVSEVFLTSCASLKPCACMLACVHACVSATAYLL